MNGIIHGNWAYPVPTVTYTSSSVVLPITTSYDELRLPTITNVTASLTSAVWKTDNITVKYNTSGTHVAIGVDGRGRSTSLSANFGTSSIFLVPASGSMLTHIISQSISRETGSIIIYSTRDHGTQTFIRNTEHWLGDVVGITAISPHNNVLNGQQGCSAITRRHIIAANHAPPGVGTIVWWVDRNSNNVSRSIEIGSRVLDTDIWIGILNEDLPVEIESFRLFPSDLTQSLHTLISGIAQNRRVPVVCNNQSSNCFVRDATTATVSINWSAASSSFVTASLVSTIAGGDSGRPVSFIINNELIPITHNFSSQAGPNYVHYKNNIQLVMDNLCLSSSLDPVNYPLEYIDISEFPVYV